MKKLTKTLTAMLALAIVAMSAIPAFAGISYAPNGSGWKKNDIVKVKKADPGNVIKDGVIGDGEYERLNVDLGADTSPLILVGFTEESLDNARAMFPTMEYYFSWDEVHGFNFAVRNKPVVVQQLLELADGDYPEDDFARNTAYVISFDADGGDNVLYYALAKRTDNGEYLEGYYENQLGATRSYDPEPGVDYVISYGKDGYVTIEWSIPRYHFVAESDAKTPYIGGTISATAGTAVVPFGGHDKEDSYVVSLGDFGYGVDRKLMVYHVVYDLTDEPLLAASDNETEKNTEIESGTDAETSGDPEESASTDTGADTGTDTNTGTNTGTDTDTETGKGENTETGTGTQTESGTGTGTGAGASTETGSGSGAGTGSNTNNGSVGGTGSDTAASSGSASAPRTGDPMVIISAVAAVTAAGAFIIGKKRR